MAKAKTTVIIDGDSKQFTDETKKAEKQATKSGDKISKTFKAIGSAIAVQQVVKFGNALIDLAEKQARAESKLEAVIRATGEAAGFSADEMKRRAAELQQMTAIGDEVILNGMAILATFKEIKGARFDEAVRAMLDLSIVMDGDLKSAALQLGKALNDPVKGINALARSGVSFSPAAAQMIKELVEMGDTAKAQGIILQEVFGQVGGAAEDFAKTTAGQIQLAEANLSDKGEKIGEHLAELKLAFLGTLDEMAEGLLEFNKTLEDTGTLFGSLGGALTGDEPQTARAKKAAGGALDLLDLSPLPTFLTDFAKDVARKQLGVGQSPPQAATTTGNQAAAPVQGAPKGVIVPQPELAKQAELMRQMLQANKETAENTRQQQGRFGP